MELCLAGIVILLAILHLCLHSAARCETATLSHTTVNAAGNPSQCLRCAAGVDSRVSVRYLASRQSQGIAGLCKGPALSDAHHVRCCKGRMQEKVNLPHEK